LRWSLRGDNPNGTRLFAEVHPRLESPMRATWRPRSTTLASADQVCRGRCGVARPRRDYPNAG
jgi:hypothetical protein